MQWGSNRLLEELRTPFVSHTVMDMYDGDSLVPSLTDIPVMSGKISSDRSANARHKLDAEILMDYPVGFRQPFNPYSTRCQVYYGVELGGRTIEYVPVGRFRIEDANQTNRNSLAITGSSLESYVVDDRFLTPRKPPTGSSTIATIIALIRETLPTAQFRVTATTDSRVLTVNPWEKERWNAISDLAESNNSEVYCDAQGVFVITDAPNINKPVVWSFNAGPNGVLVSYGRKTSRDGVFNVVVASGQSTDPAIPPVWAAAYDADVNSPTYWLGDFGRVPRFYSSQFFYTEDQCFATAANLLVRSLIPNASIDFSATPNPCIEVGDVVEVRYDEIGLRELHLTQTRSMGLGRSSPWSLTTLMANAGSASENDGSRLYVPSLPLQIGRATLAELAEMAA